MKIRTAVAFVGLAFSFALPISAQQKDTTDPEVRSADPEVRRQIEAAIVKYEEAYNKYDAAALAALYTQNAIEVVAWEPAADVAVGQQAIEKKYASLFVSNPRKLSHTVVQVYIIGNDMCAMSDLSHHYVTQEGCYVAIYVRDADTWKIRMAYAN
jgi:ketosteroid isomerase-like protein